MGIILSYLKMKISILKHTHTHTHICIYICISMYVCIHIFTRNIHHIMYILIYICIHVYMHIYVYMYTYMYIPSSLSYYLVNYGVPRKLNELRLFREFLLPTLIFEILFVKIICKGWDRGYFIALIGIIFLVREFEMIIE